jgi:hypothetical protein
MRQRKIGNIRFLQFILIIYTIKLYNVIFDYAQYIIIKKKTFS